MGLLSSYIAYLEHYSAVMLRMYNDDVTPSGRKKSLAKKSKKSILGMLYNY